MSIIRTIHNKENPYVLINKNALRDGSLSLKARGLWALCLSYPSDWKFHVKELVKHCKEGRTSVYAAIDELIEQNYAMRIEYKERREDGKIMGSSIEYIFFEFRVTEEEKELHREEFKKSFRRSGFRDAVIQPILSNEEQLNNEIVCVDESPVAPSSHVEKITKVGFDHKEIHISKQNLFEEAVRNREDWTTQEIEDVWKVLVEYKGPMRDWFKFCKGTIKNQRKLRKLKELEESNLECKSKKKKQNLREPSENSNETPSANDMQVLHCLSWKELKEQFKRSKDIC